MQNFYAIETEAAFQRAEWQRAMKMATLAAEAQPARRRWAWVCVPHLLLARLRALSLAWAPCAPALTIAQAGSNAPGCAEEAAPV